MPTPEGAGGKMTAIKVKRPAQVNLLTKLYRLKSSDPVTDQKCQKIGQQDCDLINRFDENFGASCRPCSVSTSRKRVARASRERPKRGAFGGYGWAAMPSQPAFSSRIRPATSSRMRVSFLRLASIRRRAM